MIATVITSTRSTGSDDDPREARPHLGQRARTRPAVGDPGGGRRSACRHQVGRARAIWTAPAGDASGWPRGRGQEARSRQRERQPGCDDEQHPGQQRPGQVQRDGLHRDEPGVGPLELRRAGTPRTRSDCAAPSANVSADVIANATTQSSGMIARPSPTTTATSAAVSTARAQVGDDHHPRRVQPVDQGTRRDRHDQPRQRRSDSDRRHRARRRIDGDREQRQGDDSQSVAGQRTGPGQRSGDGTRPVAAGRRPRGSPAASSSPRPAELLGGAATTTRLDCAEISHDVTRLGESMRASHQHHSSGIINSCVTAACRSRRPAIEFDSRRLDSFRRAPKVRAAPPDRTVPSATGPTDRRIVPAGETRLRVNRVTRSVARQ